MTNGAARYNALVDIEAQGPEWLEWAGAMYESYAADYGMNVGYALAADRAAEDAEVDAYRAINAATIAAYDAATGDWFS